MTKIMITGIFVAIIFTRAAAAVPPAQDSHARAATELLLTMNFEKEIASGVETMTDIMIKQNAMLGPYKKVLLKWAASFMTWDTLGPRVVALYEAAFTESELLDMSAFYKTPTGQKALTEMPKLTRQLAELGAAAATEHVQELEPLIRARAAEIEQLTAKP
jgi:hypothetical protein